MYKRIFIKDWLLLKPYEQHTKTDSYYLQISNEIKKVITESKYLKDFQEYINQNGINLLSCFLTSYLEDLISGTNIWNTFIKIHKELYGKALPFYHIEEYYEEEINVQDVAFLIWYFINVSTEDEIIHPYNAFILETAIEIIDVLDDAWEYAPENEDLKSFYQIDENETEYYPARELIGRLLFNTYLFYPDTALKLKEREAEIIKKNRNDQFLLQYLNDNRDNNLLNLHTKLLSLTGKEWVAELLSGSNNIFLDFKNISQKINGYFFYKGQDSQYILIEHIASGKKFNLTKKSFDFANTLEVIDTILYIGIVKWKKEWWFSGVSYQQDFNANLVLDEKNSIKSRQAVNFLDFQNEKADEVIQKQSEAFLAFNNGSPIAFMPKSEMERFFNAYLDYYTKSLQLTTKEIEEALKRSKEDGYFGSNNEFDLSDAPESGLVFFNPKSGVEMAFEVNAAFPMSSNPYYNEADSNDHILRLLLDNSLSKELAMYCIDNCKNKLAFFESGMGKIVLENLDFLLRFWKRKNYHTTPTITFTGIDEEGKIY